MDNRPIGVFDSGVGGLTVLKEIIKRLPGENYIYFGDCGRAPYGVKSPETIRRYTFQNIRFFLKAGVKLLVVACNTMSAHAYESVAAALEIPALEVIRPGAAAAAGTTLNKKIGIIGTTATIESRVYEKVVSAINPSVQIFAKACPLFVPLVEEGPYWWNSAAARIIAEEYLGEMRNFGIDCLVLGCTHYPLLSGVISEAAGAGIKLISSAESVASEVYNILNGDNRGVGTDARVEFYTSDSPEKFKRFCGAIFGDLAGMSVKRLDIEKFDGAVL